jgi:hypothetical protein
VRHNVANLLAGYDNSGPPCDKMSQCDAYILPCMQQDVGEWIIIVLTFKCERLYSRHAYGDKELLLLNQTDQK